MLKKFIAFISCLLLVLPAMPLWSSVTVLAGEEPDYLINVDFSKYAHEEGMTLDELKDKYSATDKSLSLITASGGNGDYIIKDGMLQISVIDAREGVVHGANLQVGMTGVSIADNGKYYIELEGVPVTDKQTQYILTCNNTGGGSQMSCLNFSGTTTGFNFNNYDPAHAKPDPGVTYTKNIVNTVRHLWDVSNRQFDGFWTKKEGASFVQHTFAGSNILGFRYAGMKTAASAPRLSSINLSGGNSGNAAAGDVLHKISHIRIWESEDSVLARAIDRLTLANVNNSSPIVTGDLSLPNSLENYKGVNITWESDNQNIISNTGAVTLPQENTEVTLTATLELNGVTVPKSFTLLVRGHSAQDYILTYETFADSKALVGWEVLSSGGTVKSDNGLIMTKTNDTDLSCMATYYFTDKTSPFRLQGDISTEIIWAASGFNKDASATFKATDGTEAAAMRFVEGDDGYDLEYVYSPSIPQTGVDYAYNVVPGEGTQVRSTVHLNTDTQTAEFWYGNEKNPISNAYMLNPADDINAVTFDIGGKNSNRGTLTVKSMKISMPNTQRLPMNYGQLDWNLLANEPQNAVTFLTLPTRGAAGVEIEWSSSNEDVVTNEGAIIRSGVDKPVTLTAKLYKEENPSDFILKTFDLTVKALNMDNLAYQKSVLSNITANPLYPLTNLTDGTLVTEFISGGSEGSGYIRVNLEKVQPISGIKIYENQVKGNYKINKYSVETSINGDGDWKKIAEGEKIGESKSISFIPVKAQYVRFNIESKSPTGPLSISEFEIFFNSSDSEIVNSDLKWLASITDGWPYNVTSDFTLPKTGEFGSTISWNSDHPNLISNDGRFLKNQENDTVVTLTATVTHGSASKTLAPKYLVPGSNTGSSPGRNPSSSISSGNTGYMPIINGPIAGSDADKGKPENKGFNDLESVPWAVEAIEALRINGIVSGDGSGKFSPGRSVTREEFVKMLVASLDIPVSENIALPFEDCAADSWYYGYVAAAYEHGLVSGFDENTFGIGTHITRQDMIVMLHRALEKIGALPEAGADTVSFADADDISTYAREAVDTLRRAGIVNGDEAGRFRPKDNTARSEAGVVLYSLVK